MKTWHVEFDVNTDDQWDPAPTGGLTSLGNTGITVPAGASIAEKFIPGYFYYPPVNIGDPVTAQYFTTEPPAGYIPVTDPQTTR